MKILKKKPVKHRYFEKAVEKFLQDQAKTEWPKNSDNKREKGKDKCIDIKHITKK